MALKADFTDCLQSPQRVVLVVLAIAGLVVGAACTSSAPAPVSTVTSTPAKPAVTGAPTTASPGAAAPKVVASPRASSAASPGVSALASPGPSTGARVLITDASLADA